MVEKKCTKCGNVLPVTEFNKSKTGNAGLSSWCRECCRVNCRTWRADNKECASQSAKKWVSEHRTEVLEARRVYVKTDAGKAAVKRGYDNYANSVHGKAMYKDREARSRAEVHSGEDMCTVIEQMLRTFRGCPYCGSVNLPTLDHKIPLSRGGLHTILNIQIICFSCNSKKGLRTDAEYRESLILRDTLQKRCVTCRQIKSVGMFHKLPAHSDGRSSSCGDCDNARRRADRERKHICKDY